MKIIGSLFITVALIQLSQVFAASNLTSSQHVGLPEVLIPPWKYDENTFKKWNSRLHDIVVKLNWDNQELYEKFKHIETWAPNILKVAFYSTAQFYLGVHSWIYSYARSPAKFEDKYQMEVAAYNAITYAMNSVFLSLVRMFKSLNEMDKVKIILKFKQNLFELYAAIKRAENRIVSPVNSENEYIGILSGLNEIQNVTLTPLPLIELPTFDV